MAKYAAKIVAVCLAGMVMTDVAFARGGRGGAGGGAARGGRPSGGGAMRSGPGGGGPSIGAGAAHGPANIGGGPAGHVGGPAQNARSLNNGNLNNFLGIAGSQPAARTQGASSQAANFASQAQSLAAQSGFSAQAQNAATQASSAAQNFATQASSYAASQPDPFTPAWYAAHPNAFQATHPYALEEVMAAAAVPNWLGVPYAATGYGVTGTGYVTVNGEPAAEEEAATETQPQSQPAAQPTSAAPVVETQETLSLGVFALAPEGDKEITRMIQLAVAKDGTLKGSYYDVLSEQVHAINGSVDKSTMMATWTVSDSGKLTFQTNVNSLTQDRPTVTIRYADGKISQWTLIRSKTAS